MIKNLSAAALLLTILPGWATSSPNISAVAGPGAAQSVITCPAIDAIRVLPHGVFTAALGDVDGSAGITGEWLGLAAPGSRPTAFDGALIIRTEPSLPDMGIFSGCLYRMDDGAALKLRLARRDPTPLKVAVIEPAHWRQDGHVWLSCSSADPAHCGAMLLDGTVLLDGILSLDRNQQQ